MLAHALVVMGNAHTLKSGTGKMLYSKLCMNECVYRARR